MGQEISIDGLLYQQAVEGNVEMIKFLCRDGAGLEWVDKDGKNALILASMDPRLYLVAKTLIEMGANVNAYRPGHRAGTPLHHAAKRGLDQTVRLLLSHGANAYVRNDACLTPLEVARVKGFNNVVRAIEGHICYYSGQVREFLAPGFFEKSAPQLLSRTCWAVVVPCNPPNLAAPPKLELALYPTEQDPKPYAVIPLWKTKIEDPKFQQPDPVLIVFYQSWWKKILTKDSKTRYKFKSAIVGDKPQIWRLYNACKGISQVTPSSIPTNDPATPAPTTSTTDVPNSQPSSSMNDNGWGVSTQDASHNNWTSSTNPPPSKASSSGWTPEPETEGFNGWALPESSTAPPQSASAPPTTTTTEPIGSSSFAPSAPPLPYDDGPIHYPSIDMTSVEEVPVPEIQNEAPKSSESKDNDENLCVICWEAPIEGACIPCGHMAGCMSCLNQIKSKKGDCPVCRGKINQVVRLYAV